MFIDKHQRLTSIKRPHHHLALSTIAVQLVGTQMRGKINRNTSVPVFPVRGRVGVLPADARAVDE